MTSINLTPFIAKFKNAERIYFKNIIVTKVEYDTLTGFNDHQELYINYNISGSPVRQLVKWADLSDRLPVLNLWVSNWGVDEIWENLTILYAGLDGRTKEFEISNENLQLWHSTLKHDDLPTFDDLIVKLQSTDSYWACEALEYFFEVDKNLYSSCKVSV